MYRTITAKYPGTCNRCNGPIKVGDKIRFGGTRRLYHFAADCPKGTTADAPADLDTDTPPPSYHYSVTDDDRQTFTTPPDLDF